MISFQKLDIKFDIDVIKNDILDIIKDYPSLSQIGLTHSMNVQSEQEKVLESVGSAYNKDTGKLNFKETQFTEFNNKYKNTSLYDVYRSLPNIGRFRIMIMNGPSCYTIHRDFTPRYHLAVETNKNCLFLFTDQKEMHHIPADGYVYYLDTRSNHTFVNGSKDRRIHLVLDDISMIK